ncbi:MAG: hypothetical protein JXN59_07100 [Anaerolineae bacterium]|nr:hypothetical protein [Anaerolineae bacterium]
MQAQSSSIRSVLDARWIWPSVAILLCITALVAVTAPAERTLGGPNARLVYFHGALVWASLLTWFVAAGVGGVALVRRSATLHRTSRVLGRIGLLWWALYIPVSILAANATWANNSWNLTFLLEPRFSMAFQTVAVMLVAQAIQVFDSRPPVASLVNIGVVVLLVVALGLTERVLHPPAPIRDTESLRIQLAFASMTGLLLLAGFQLARLPRLRI